MGNFGSQCVFLLGAGASADAGIPVSSRLNEIVRKKVETDYSDKASEERQLYNFLAGTIFYHRGLKNTYPGEEDINIEEILSVLNLLQKRDDALLSAFVGNWHDKLRHFDNRLLSRFEKWIRRLVVEKLSVQGDKAEYLKWFIDLHKKKNSTINIFTLNQDITLETCFGKQNYSFINGFDSKNRWNPLLFDGEEAEGSNAINVHKLHGSIGWRRTEENEIEMDKDMSVSDSHLMIFGIMEKLTIDEPFFELVKRFKEKANASNLLVIIGYSFQDEYINNVIFDSLRFATNKRVLIVDKNADRVKERLAQKYTTELNQTLVEYMGSEEKRVKQLFESDDLTRKIDDLISGLSQAPF